MKPIKKPRAKLFGLLSFVVLGSLMFARAQDTGTTTSPPPSTDSLVALAADSQSLPVVSWTDVPKRGGTFWWVYPGSLAIPTPILPLDLNGVAIYQIPSSSPEFLVDLTENQVMVTPWQLRQAAQVSTNAYAAAVAAQVQGLINLITWLQNPPPTPDASAAMPMGGGGGLGPLDQTQGPFPYLTIASTGTNQFLITVFNTNSATYYLQMTPVLANTNYPWTIIVNGSAGQTNFSVTGLYQDEFFRVLMATNSPGQGIAVFIDSPANGATVQ
jgi:hypothetical protein